MNQQIITFNNQYFDLIKQKFTQLNDVELKNNMLFFKEFSVDLKSFKLSSLKLETFYLYPFDLLNIIKIHVDIMDELEYIKENDYNSNYLYFKVRTLLVKKVLNNAEYQELNSFIDSYLELQKYQDYLVDYANKKFDYMKSVIRDNIYGNNIDMTPGKALFIQKIDENDGRSSNKGGPKLVLKNPNFPNMMPEEENNLYQKSGFVSLLLILYIIINIGFILAIFILK